MALAERRAGSQFDPTLAAALCANAETILDGLDAGPTWDAVIGAEPALGVLLSEEEFDRALLAIADFVDLKSPYTLGHARAVSELAAEAGMTLGLEGNEVETLRRAGLATGWGVSACRTPSGTSAGPSGLGSGNACACTPI